MVVVAILEELGELVHCQGRPVNELRVRVGRRKLPLDQQEERAQLLN